MARATRRSTQLNAKETLIAETLRAAGRPLSAYEIIARLPDGGASAPTTVYRALKRLLAAGHAHRIESLNAFVSCAQHGHENSTVFAICDQCGAVAEFDDAEVANKLISKAQERSFAVTKLTLELRGHCGVCARLANASKT